ncbi:MAG: Trk K+ transport system NAD-binding subunit/nucleotide-binding universal stress UspA family protein [Myxococcota bacterium]
MRTHRHVVLIGAGEVGLALLAELPVSWTVSAVDTSAEALAVLPETHGGQTILKVQGDATSRLVLNQVGLSTRTMVAILTGSDETNLEIARVIRAHFQVDDLVCQLNSAENSAANGLTGNEIALRSVAAARHTMNHFSRSEPHLLADQLARGELQVIQVLPGSAAIGRTLSQLKPRRWLVAAIYRNDALIVPHGETVLESGDRVMLTGEPDVVDSVANFIHGAEAVFPSQYGASIGYLGDDEVQKEAAWLLEKTQAEHLISLPSEKLDTNILSATDIALNLSRQEVGLLVLESRPLRLSSRLGLRISNRKKLILAARVPVLIARSQRPYKRILLAVSSQDSVNAISVIAMDIATLVGASLTVLTVLPPSLSKGEEALAPLRAVPRQVADLGRLHGLEVDTVISEGNPIKQIRSHAANFDLLVVGHSHQSRNTLFTPDISMYLLHSTPCSVLFVPWNVAGR